MATYVIGLEDQANPGLFKASPTLAAGDFKVSKDGGGLTNLTNLPTVTPAGGKLVEIVLTTAEMTATNVTVVCSDAAGAEWYDLIINIQPAVANQIDDIKADTAAVKVKTDYLPSATAGGAGGVFVAGANAATTVNLTGNLSGSVGSVTGAVGSVAANGITATSIATDAIKAATVKADAVTKIQAGLATPTNITAGTITTATNLTNAPTNGDLTSAMKASVTTAATAATPTAAAVTGAVGSVTAPVTAGTVSDKAGYALSSAGIQAIWDALTNAMTTVGSIGKRIADYLDVAVSSRGTYAGGDTSGTTTLLSRIVGTLAAGTHNAQSGDAYARIGAAGAGLTALASQTSVDDIPTNAELTAALAGASSGGGLTAQETVNAVHNLAPVGTVAVGSVGGKLDSLLSYSAGAGAVPLTYTLTSSVGGTPIAGADVWATTDLAGTNTVARGVTNAFGQVTFYLDAGTYYIWRQLAGWTFTNPDTEVVA